MVKRDTLKLGDQCYVPPGLCVEEGIFRDTIDLPNNPNGYYLSWGRCCRNAGIQNIVAPLTIGMVFYAEMPDPALHNSSPVFGKYPNAYMCQSQLNTQNFSCYDIDGDSLAYSLITPLAVTNANSIPPPAPKPYLNVTWQAPYKASDMMGGSPVMAIDPKSGILTAILLAMPPPKQKPTTPTFPLQSL